MSRGLPGVRWCIVKPNVEDDRLFPSQDDESGTRTPREQDSISALPVDSIREAVNYHGITVGPWAPPSKFDPLVSLGTLVSFVRESRAEGWILSDAGAQKYLTLIAQAKSEVRKSDLKTVLECLDKILGRLRPTIPEYFDQRDMR